MLVALNGADVHRLSFIQSVLPEAARQGMGVIGMKVLGQGVLLSRGGLTAREAMSYVLSLSGVSTVVIGCKTPAEVDENARIAQEFAALDEDVLREFESRTRKNAAELADYKRP